MLGQAIAFAADPLDRLDRIAGSASAAGPAIAVYRSASAQPNQVGAADRSIRWRETGAKKRDFRLQTAILDLEKRREDTEFNHLALAPALAKVGVGGSNPLTCSSLDTLKAAENRGFLHFR